MTKTKGQAPLAVPTPTTPVNEFTPLSPGNGAQVEIYDDSDKALPPDKRMKHYRLMPSRAGLKAEVGEWGIHGHLKLKLKQMTAEFFGTGLFVFMGGLSLHNRIGGLIVYADILAIALSHGLTIAILASSMGHISGGHFNPAVSLGVYLAGGMQVLQMLGYWTSQIFGSYLGALLIRGCVASNTYISFSGGTLNLDPNLASPFEGCCLEVIMTLHLVLTVLMTTVDSVVPTVWAPWAIGFTIAVANFAGGTITGASMNPARSFGPLAAYGTLFPSFNCTEFQLAQRAHNLKCELPQNMWEHHWIAWAGPAIGAVLAALIYRLLFAAPHKNLLIKEA